MTLLSVLTHQNMTLVCLIIDILLSVIWKMPCSCRKIRPCPSANPGCVSTNPKSSSFAFPWRIPESTLDNAIQVLNIYVHSPWGVRIWTFCCMLWDLLDRKSFGSNIFLPFELNCAWSDTTLCPPILQKLQEAILRTQKNANIQVVEDTPNGKQTELYHFFRS